MAKHQLKREQLTELLLQALETELGGVQVYENAVKNARNEDLKEEWEKYLDQTREHVEIVTELCQSLGVDPQQESPGRLVVRGLGEALVKAMQAARRARSSSARRCSACGRRACLHARRFAGAISRYSPSARRRCTSPRARARERVRSRPMGGRSLRSRRPRRRRSRRCRDRCSR